MLRYVLCAISPENKDSDFSWKDFQARNNNELGAIFGNFVNRTLVLTHKYFDGVAPERNALEKEDIAVLDVLKQTPLNVEKAIRSFRFRDAQAEAMKLARAGNKYLADTEPWKQIKTNPDRVKTILNISLQITASLAVVFEPFMPHISSKLASMLGIELPKWDAAGNSALIAIGHTINNPEILFAKIEDEQMMLNLKS